MWYDVKMSGYYNNEWRAVDETVQAGNPEAAVQIALAKKFNVGFSGDVGWKHLEGDGYPGPRLLTFTLGEWGQFVTGHEQLSDVVADADPVRVARLTGAPTLPLDLGATPAPSPTAAVATGNPDAYQRQALATWGSAADTPREQRLHALLGLVGEAGEVANLVKKQLYKPGVVDDNAAVIDELADVAYYLAVLASLYGVTFDGLFAHLAGKLAGGHGWLNPSNSTGLEVNGE
jgi:NTP pyrophosphatase (non-canonical NTP hydrolase)